MRIPKYTEELLEALADSLQIPPSRYESAERSYHSVGRWLNRPASRLHNADPQVYLQGSFKLGTAIRPASDKENYDVDLVCELSISKKQSSQAELKAALGLELQDYAKGQGMEPPVSKRRCWTQNYADGAQFHMDTLPAIPDATRQSLLLELEGYDTKWIETAIAITDQEHPNFRQITSDWPHSNPKGYANWFMSRMEAIFEARRRSLALEARASVESIPNYTVRTPLQSAIQILKRHRDMMFNDRSDDKPISIILTTLSAHAYEQETTISAALFSILERMDRFIKVVGGIDWIENPTDPRENFADRWVRHPELRTAFYDWLTQARQDFTQAAQAINLNEAATVLQPRFGKQMMESAIAKQRRSSSSTLRRQIHNIGRALNPGHRQTPPWSKVNQGKVTIKQALMRRNGFRPQNFSSDYKPLPKQCGLSFEATTDIPMPYKVYWQVVNTGGEAQLAGGLRGDFSEGSISNGKLKRRESTLYSGTHSIECFIVKNGYLAAASGQFIVNIE